jgi:hypothetical protein
VRRDKRLNVHRRIAHVVVNCYANRIGILWLDSLNGVENLHQGSIVDVVPVNLELGIRQDIFGNVVVCLLVAPKLARQIELDFLDHRSVEAVERDGKHLDAVG